MYWKPKCTVGRRTVGTLNDTQTELEVELKEPETGKLKAEWRCRQVPDILGLVWPRFRPNSDPKSKISGRIQAQC